jgi:hypothetical protein
MADTPRSPDTGDDKAGPVAASTRGVPRWVKVFGIIAIVLALVVAIMLLTGGGGGHGPGRHGLDGRTSLTLVT